MAIPTNTTEEVKHTMKTITQRLQSRISKRRNVIRQVEQDVAVLKTQRHMIRELNLGDYGYSVVANLNETLRDAREFVKNLADDQKLDKRLKNIVLERAQLYGIHDY